MNFPPIVRVFHERRIIVPTTITNVSVLTALLAYSNLGQAYSALLFALVNNGASPVTLFIDTSEDGAAIDAAAQQTLTAAPGQQCSLEVGPEQMRSFFRLTAQTVGPAWPVSACSWTVLGRPRM